MILPHDANPEPDGIFGKDTFREPAYVLAELKARMGLMDFSAQYLQQPIPIEGNLIKRDWLKTYLVPPQPQPGDTYVISWDTAMKARPESAISVALAIRRNAM